MEKMPNATATAGAGAGASAATTGKQIAKDKKEPRPSSSFPWLSLVVGVAAAAVAALSLLQPAAFDAARTRALQLVDRFHPLGNVPASVDCSLAEQYVTDVLPVKGFHVLCLKKDPGDRCARHYTVYDTRPVPRP